MRALVVFAAFAVVIASSSCNCAGAPPGSPCTEDTECESGRCDADKTCSGISPDGGGKLPDGGGTGTLPDGGTSTLPDGGTGTLPDGGACEGLQCQVAVCPGGGTTRITGKVYDPAGNVPLYNAIVYVPNKPLKPFTPGPSCDSCGALVSGNPVAITISGADGAFTLDGVPAGTDIPLVVQIGKWRRLVTLPAITACQTTALTDAGITRLPRNRTEGDMPQIAISSGNADAFECLLRKMGIADSEVTSPANGGRVHFYRQNGLNLNPSAPAGSTLWTDAGTLMGYDVVILPCEGNANNKPAAAVQNMVSYANAGGRVFATHYSYVWTQPGWPQAATWQPGLPDLFNTTFTVTADQSFPKGQAFAQWLLNVGASTDAGFLDVRESRHDVVSVNTGSTRWLYGDIPASNPSGSIQHLTFNTPFLDAGTTLEGGAKPQCGRVVFSDFHVTAGATDGGNRFPDTCANGALTAQEKALEFMLFDLSACVQDDKTAPTVCATVGQSCASDSACCSGLKCKSNTSPTCPGPGCTCEPSIG